MTIFLLYIIFLYNRCCGAGVVIMCTVYWLCIHAVCYVFMHCCSKWWCIYMHIHHTRWSKLLTYYNELPTATAVFYNKYHILSWSCSNLTSIVASYDNKQQINSSYHLYITSIIPLPKIPLPKIPLTSCLPLKVIYYNAL
jgi:hypothetical protein